MWWTRLPRVGVFSREPHGFFVHISKPDSLWSLRYGFEEQNPSRGVWLMGMISNLLLSSPLPQISRIVWKNLEEHNAFMTCESYVDFALSIMEAMVGHGEITQVLLKQHQDFFWAIASPVTQFIYITLYPRHDRNSELTPLLERLARELTSVPGCYGSSWGPSLQHDNVCVGIVGWRSAAVCFYLIIILYDSSSALRIGIIPWFRQWIIYEKSAAYIQGLPDFHDSVIPVSAVPAFSGNLLSSSCLSLLRCCALIVFAVYYQLQFSYELQDNAVTLTDR